MAEDKPNLTPAPEKDRDETSDFPGVNTSRDNKGVQPGSKEASEGVGDMQESTTEAARGTSGKRPA